MLLEVGCHCKSGVGFRVSTIESTVHVAVKDTCIASEGSVSVA